MGFVLLILYLCSLPVFSGVCVIDSVSVFTASFQWGLCHSFCSMTCLHVLFRVVMSAMLFVFIYVYWSPAQFLYQMMFVLFNSNRWVYHVNIFINYFCNVVFPGASLVKGIPFNWNDPEVSGPDIFQKLVPMSAHEASSMYR